MQKERENSIRPISILLPDLPHGIVENRQPIKAALDVLEFFRLVRKTGKAKRGSDEYEINSENVILTTIYDFDNRLV